MTATFTQVVTLVKFECAKCGVSFAIPQKLEQERRNDHETFYCPNGHIEYFPYETTEEFLRRQLEAKTAEANRQRENYFAEQRRHEQTQKKMTQLKKRTAAGVCPCCKRTFSQLARHMQSKHTEFVKEHGVPVVEKPKE